jgi:hypothetical protein
MKGGMPTQTDPPTPSISLSDDRVRIGTLSIRFHRTLRLPDDGRTYPLPPSLGLFPIHRVAEFAGRVPASWRGDGGVFLPMHQREAMWLSFECEPSQPIALKVAAGMRNALTGDEWDERIEAGRDQDYLVCPDQPWLDGFNAGDGMIRQFIAMPLGMGYTAEGQLSGEERFGGIQLLAFLAKPGRVVPPVFTHELRIEDAPSPAGPMAAYRVTASARLPSPGAEMGLAGGGRMHQQIHPDPHGADVWDTGRSGRLFVHIVDAGLYEQITGRPAPPSPISARTYTEHGLPWFAEYGGGGDIAPAKKLAGLKSVAEKDAEHGFSVQDDGSVEVPATQVTPVTGPRPFSDPVR